MAVAEDRRFDAEFLSMSGRQVIPPKRPRQNFTSFSVGFLLKSHGMPRNEAQTRFDLIVPILRGECGGARTAIRIEETAAAVDGVYKKGKRRPKGRTDYVIRHPLQPDTEPIPLAIIEAKAENLPS